MLRTSLGPFSTSCLKILQLLQISYQVTFVTNPEIEINIEINTLFPIFNKKGLASFKVRPNHNILKEINAG